MFKPECPERSALHLVEKVEQLLQLGFSIELQNQLQAKGSFPLCFERLCLHEKPFQADHPLQKMEMKCNWSLKRCLMKIFCNLNLK